MKPWNHSHEEECVNNDELVKYMSKLPSYLQPVEIGEESDHSNVLNVGVLDWGRLEKWKHSRAKRSGKCQRKVSSTSTALPTFPKGSSYHRSKLDDQVHDSSLVGKVQASRGLQHGLRCTFLEPEFASRDSLNKQEIATCSFKSSGRDHERVKKNPRKSRRSRSYQKPTAGLLSQAVKRAGHAQEARERASESGKQCAENLDVEEKKVVVSNHHIVLLRSRKQSGSTLSGEPQKSMDHNVKVTREVNRSLDFSSHGISSSLGLRSQIHRSCPLSFDLERDSEDMRLPLGVDLSGKKEPFGGTTRQSKTASRNVDQEMREDDSKKKRHTSQSNRFSFSFSRLSRSFTFREDSAGQPLSSSDDTIKFDSIRCDGSTQSEKQNIHCGSGVSPLRRLLDPLLKSKGSEIDLPSEARSSSSNPKPTSMDVTLKDEKKQDTSRNTRALFQLTTRNGIPLFQFVVDDNLSSRSILGATMKNSDSSSKDGSLEYCTFYSVEEVKKKKGGSWLLHGHKEKQRGFVYNVMGQMRLCSPMSSENKSESVSSVIRESVLVDESEKVKGQRKELAAVVIKKKPAEENLNALEESETTVIIPGGVHSYPEKGAPTPLVSRWRSGGLCDCGGWDVGCKLHILSNKTLLHELLDQSFKLFHQEKSDQDSGPVLAMTELKTGIYRVEFGSFLSHLQAFFVCVTLITCASEESKTTGKSSSTFAPPLSPVGRV